MSWRRSIWFGLVTAVLVLQGLGGQVLAAAQPAQTVAPVALNEMPCEGEQLDAQSHDQGCDMGCDSAPDSQDFKPVWAPSGRPPTLDLPDVALPAPGIQQLAAARRHAVRTGSPRGPPLRQAADSPVARADRLLN
jgi:hypothetical protein